MSVIVLLQQRMAFTFEGKTSHEMAMSKKYWSQTLEKIIPIRK